MNETTPHTPTPPSSIDAPAPASALTPESLRRAIEPVIDPEIGISIVHLGLIYDTKMLDGDIAYALMTLTSPMCPMGPQIMNDVHQTLAKVPGVKDVKVELTFNPPWDPKTMADDDTKMMLGIF